MVGREVDLRFLRLEAASAAYERCREDDLLGESAQSVWLVAQATGSWLEAHWLLQYPPRAERGSSAHATGPSK